jgi:excisionase family DNA binding protein
VTVNEATRALRLSDQDYVYRLLRSGALRGRRVGRCWVVDDDSVRERIRKLEHKRSSRSNAQAERTRRMVEAEAAFAPRSADA